MKKGLLRAPPMPRKMPRLSKITIGPELCLTERIDSVYPEAVSRSLWYKEETTEPCSGGERKGNRV